MTDQSPEPGPNRRSLNQLRELVASAKAGDLTVLPALREFLARRHQLWKQTEKLAQNATALHLDMICGDDVPSRQALMERLKTLKSELTDPSTTKLESLLIDRIVVCRLQLLLADLLHAHGNSGEPGQAKFHEQQLDRAQRRFGYAVKQLAVLRKLLPDK